MRNKKIFDWYGSSGGGAVVEYQAVLNRATALGYVKPSAAQQAKQNQLIIDLKSAGIWDLLDVFYVFATDGDSDYATLNWKDSSSFQTAKVNSPTFTANQGFRAPGATSYLNTGWAPSLNGVNYTLNNSAFGFHVIGNSQSDLFDNGTVGAAGITTRTWASVRTGTNGTQFNINSSGALTPGSTDSSGFYHVKRSSSTATAVFKNGASISSAATTAEALSERPFFICTHNGNGTPGSSITTRTYSMFFAGAGLNGLESSLYTAWNTYLTSL